MTVLDPQWWMYSAHDEHLTDLLEGWHWEFWTNASAGVFKWLIGDPIAIRDIELGKIIALAILTAEPFTKPDDPDYWQELRCEVLSFNGPTTESLGIPIYKGSHHHLDAVVGTLLVEQFRAIQDARKQPRQLVLA